jgi:hypothetical protein
MIATALYRVNPSAPYLFGGALMLACYLYSLLSPHMRNAGLAAPEAERIEDAAENQMPNA